MLARRALSILLAFALAALIGHAWTRPLAPLSTSAPPDQFSAERAKKHLEAIAQRPHRMGSPEHARVRDYLVGELSRLGFTTEIQQATVARPGASSTRLAVVRNVVGERRGARGSGKALLMMAHYDSRAMTPGASDDGYGVAALLEALRAVRAGPPLANDVIVLFSDGEEEGLFGARAFVKGHPRARDVGLVVNFEARGNAGPAMVFQTSADNGALVRALAKASPYAVSSSLSQAVYQRMPNDTDLSEWLPHTPALNIANIGGLPRYHAPTDTIENADLGTLQHHGSLALSLLHAFGASALPPPFEPDAVSFDVGPWFVTYPGAWTMPLALVAAALLALFVIAAALRGALRPLPALAAIFLAAFTLAAAAVVAFLAWSLADALHPAYTHVHAAQPLLWDAFLAAFAALGVAFAIVASALGAPRLRAAEIFAGTSALLVALSIAAALYLPGAAFFFTWPAIGALAVGLPLALARGFESRSPLALVIAAAAPLPAIVLLAPFATQLVAAFGPMGAPAPAVIAALLALLAAPAFDMAIGTGKRQATAALGAAAILYLGANLVPPFDRDHPRPDTLFFAVDADARRASWVSPDRGPDAWSEAVLSHATVQRELPLPFPLRERASFLVAPVAAVSEPAPEIAWNDDVASPSGRAVTFRVKAPKGAEVVAVEVLGPVTRAHVAGEYAAISGDGLSFRFYAPPEQGIEVGLSLRTSDPITVKVLSQRPGFPDSASPQPGLRPPGLMAKPGMMPPWDDLLESDMTLVARTFRH